jgi:hypothetical protein
MASTLGYEIDFRGRAMIDSRQSAAIHYGQSRFREMRMKRIVQLSLCD